MSMAPKLMAHDAVDHGQQRVHDVLDPDDRDASRAQVLDGIDERLDLGLGEAAGDLVEQQDGGIAGERPGQLEPLAVEQGQGARR